MRPLFLLSVLILLSGCSAVFLTDEEQGVLGDALGEISQIAPRYKELQGLSDGVERGRDFISFSKNLGQGGATPLMNPDYFWFKVSLVERPVEPFDLQPPVFTVFFPKFNKYLKLRLTVTNQQLAAEIASGVQRSALRTGGTDVRWGNLSQPGRGRKMSRFGAY